MQVLELESDGKRHTEVVDSNDRKMGFDAKNLIRCCFVEFLGDLIFIFVGTLTPPDVSPRAKRFLL